MKFQGPFVPIVLRSILTTVAAHGLSTVCHHVVNSSTGVLVSITQRISLRILSIALEKELKILDYA